MELLNITLSVLNEPINHIINDIKTTFGDHIILWDDPWDHSEENDVTYFLTVVITEQDRDEFFIYLKTNGFTEV
jgi:hypothetical protein